LAGKTGTTDDATDLWFVGFSPSLVAGVWIGYDIKRSLGSAETGGRLALPIWVQFMRKALADTEPADFAVPENVVAVSVDSHTGRPAPSGSPGAIVDYFIKGSEPKGAGGTSPSRTTPDGEGAPPGGTDQPGDRAAEDGSPPLETSLTLPRSEPRTSPAPTAPPAAPRSGPAPPRVPSAPLPPQAGNQ
jgi:membrane carboxypeptidase/penicillin-binding protein